METFKTTTNTSPGSRRQASSSMLTTTTMRALLALLLLHQLAALLAQAALNLPDGIENILGFKPTSSFQCERDGYFGDIDNDCRIFHLCQKQVHAGGRVEWRHWTYACGNQTMFNQLTLTCAFVDEAIPCRHASQFQYLNEVIHKPREPFLTDADVTSGISYYSNRIMSDGARARAFEDAQLMAQLVQPQSKPQPTIPKQSTIAPNSPVPSVELRQEEPAKIPVTQVVSQVFTTTVPTTTSQTLSSTNPIRFVEAPQLNTFNFAISTDHKLPLSSANSVSRRASSSFSAPQFPALSATTTSRSIESITPPQAPQAFQEPKHTVVLVPVTRQQQQVVSQKMATPTTPTTGGQRTTLPTSRLVSQEIPNLSRQVRGNNGQSSMLPRRLNEEQPALVMRRAQNHHHQQHQQQQQQQQQHHHRQVRAQQTDERNFAERAFWRAPFDIQVLNPRFESLLTRRRV